MISKYYVVITQRLLRCLKRQKIFSKRGYSLKLALRNPKKKSSDFFLGFTITARKKRNRHVAHSRMCQKARENAYEKLKEAIKKISKKQTPYKIMIRLQPILIKI